MLLTSVAVEEEVGVGLVGRRMLMKMMRMGMGSDEDWDVVDDDLGEGCSSR